MSAPRPKSSTPRPGPGAGIGAPLPEALGVMGVIAASSLGALLLWLPPREVASPEACEELLRKYAEARIRQADDGAPPATVAAHRAAAQRRAAGSARFARCPREVDADQAACALRAGGADEIERCLQ